MTRPQCLLCLLTLVIVSSAQGADLFFEDQRQAETVPAPIPLVPDLFPAAEDDCLCADCKCDDCKCEAVGLEGTGPGFVDERMRSDVSQLAGRMALLESQVQMINGRITTLDGRVEKVEEQLKALLTVQRADGTQTTAEVEIDHVNGYGDFEVPPGGRVVAINGVPVARSTMATTSNVRYVTPQYAAQPVARRTVRVFPRVFGTQSTGTCRIDPVTGARICN